MLPVLSKLLRKAQGLASLAKSFIAVNHLVHPLFLFMDNKNGSLIIKYRQE
jgi:hypothetical protein